MDKAYKVLEYIEYLEKSAPMDIFNNIEIDKYKNALSFIEDLESNEIVLESNLLDDLENVDFSIKIDNKRLESLRNCMDKEVFKEILEKSNIWNKVNNFKNFWDMLDKSQIKDINDIWFEIDKEAIDKELVEPCFFFDSSNVYKNEEFIQPLILLIGEDNISNIKNNIKSCINKLPSNIGLFQLGNMLSRNEETVRAFTNELTYIELLDYLKEINWTGNIKKLEEFFYIFNEYSDKQYILDFNISSSDISSKIGVNFGLNINKENITIDFIEKLCDLGLCTEKKKNGIQEWISTSESNEIERDISHFKFAMDKEEYYMKVYFKLAPIKVNIKVNIDKW